MGPAWCLGPQLVRIMDWGGAGRPPRDGEAERNRSGVMPARSVGPSSGGRRCRVTSRHFGPMLRPAVHFVEVACLFVARPGPRARGAPETQGRPGRVYGRPAERYRSGQVKGVREPCGCRHWAPRRGSGRQREEPAGEEEEGHRDIGGVQGGELGVPPRSATALSAYGSPKKTAVGGVRTGLSGRTIRLAAGGGRRWSWPRRSCLAPWRGRC